MSWLTPEILASFARPLPGGGASPTEVEHRDAIEAQVAALPAPVQDEIVAALSDADRRLWGTTALSALALARTADLSPTGMLAPGVIGVEDSQQRALGIVPMAYSSSPHRAGAPEDLARLVAGLDATFGGRQYILYLRRVIPPDLDVGPITRAVHLWLSAIQRGEWQGQHAIYEDQQIALELSVTGGLREDQGRGLLFTVGPITALEELSTLDGKVMEHLGALDPGLGELPLVVALGSGRPWRLPRGYTQQLLLGTPDEVCAVSGKQLSYEALFRENGRSMFADPIARSLCAVWWIGPPDPGGLPDQVFAASSWDNPWSNRVAPAVACHRFRVVSTFATDGIRRAVMTWTGRTPGEGA